MKTMLFLLFLSLPTWAQTPKSAELPVDEARSTREKNRLEKQEDQRVRREWDRQESQARQREERKRQRDEKQAETY